MRALDLCSCAGGAARGLADAGFEVVGVDIEPQPNYPYEHHVADALTYPLEGFDLIWASPPCQQFTAYRRRGDGVGDDAPNLIPAMRARLRASGIPYIIENVGGAPLHKPIMLCGSMFGLGVQRHRFFETSFRAPQLKCRHLEKPRFAPATNRSTLRRTVEVGVYRIPLKMQQAAMGIDWMTLKELSQAIPPAYSRWLAFEFLRSSRKAVV